MSYAELIKKLQTLPEAKQVEFLANRNQIERGQQKALAESSLASVITNPLVVTDFTPLSSGQYE